MGGLGFGEIEEKIMRMITLAVTFAEVRMILAGASFQPTSRQTGLGQCHIAGP